MVLDATGVDLDLNAATAAASRETSGIGVEETVGGAHCVFDQGRILEQKGSDVVWSSASGSSRRRSTDTTCSLLHRSGDWRRQRPHSSAMGAPHATPCRSTENT